MKGGNVKRLAPIFFLAFILANAPQFRTCVHATTSSWGTIYMDPDIIIDEGNTSGSFTVNINISDGVLVYGWQVWLNWTPSVLNITTWPPLFGDYLADQPSGTYPNWFLNHTDGWALVSETSLYMVPGVYGDGWLCQLEFDILEYGSSELAFYETYTFFMIADGETPPFKIWPTTTDGYFSNKLLGDCDGDAGHDVDYDDFIILAGAYGSSSGDPGYDKRADFYRDGDVDYDDFIILAGNYGSSL